MSTQALPPDIPELPTLLTIRQALALIELTLPHKTLERLLDENPQALHHGCVVTRSLFEYLELLT